MRASQFQITTRKLDFQIREREWRKKNEIKRSRQSTLNDSEMITKFCYFSSFSFVGGTLNKFKIIKDFPDQSAYFRRCETSFSFVLVQFIEKFVSNLKQNEIEIIFWKQ